MPSQKILSEKQAYVEALKAKLDSSVAGVVVDYKGISVANDTKLRRALREANVEYAVVKNTMLRLALEGKGYTELEKTLEGTTAIAISHEDPLVAAKILCKYAEESKGAFTVKAGYMDGAEMSAAEVEAIAKLPGKQELLSMLCSALQGNIRGLAVALNAIAEKSEEVA
ncbi:50S ribosomal protein L10 [Pygmaiobacter massiliensis]|uniref:50S ribosomal protein L10 n=1 Tax=Pygmaiobacter massiliensis TaxID=1917873 RepID=UPI000C79E782|nr:50S ribosomal protein L10 [Pygmaiobacter massiliensis]MDY4784610.1 50S ribosomal protein L10 [Pygmaiobacter massiliensis]